jgi:hypothetical protein
MDLHRAGREFYTLELAVTTIDGAAIPDAGPWEASFDDRETWVTGTQNGDGWWEWLVAGPLVDAEADPVPNGVTLAATIAGTTQPQARLVDSPEILVVDGPPIYLI